jgi:type IV fimbrial biogenesis protein FimT
MRRRATHAHSDDGPRGVRFYFTSSIPSAALTRRGALPIVAVMNTPHATHAAQRPLATNTPRATGARRGFTLVEMLVTVCILGTLLAIAVPLARSFGHSMKLSSLSNAFLSQLHLARSEAIKRNGRVAICKSADGASCSAAGGWEQGWILFHDVDNDGLRDAGEGVVQRFAALPPGFRLVGNVNVAKYVSFAATGGTRTSAGAFQAGTLTVCKSSETATEARQIVINAIGRPRIQKVTVDSCL